MSRWWDTDLGVCWCDSCGKEWACHASAYYSGPTPSTCHVCGAREVWWRSDGDDA